MRIHYRLTTALVLLLCVAQAFAQMMPPIPVDKEVRMGKLDNGLTYYIRHNDYPKDVANFYIAQRVGSIQEEESQRGLAHFLEHMAFNGTKNFPGNGIIEFCRALGVEFGSDLNAYTSIDQTVYRICNVPTARQSALDSCLLVLRDWSGDILLEGDEIDKERGVIHQEWQMGSSAGMRFYEKHLPDLYPGSKYGNRLPIGLMSVVDNFAHKELRDYYHKWYRPDNQAIIVVGNVDVDHTEAEIKRLWAGGSIDPNAAQVVDEQVPDNAEPIFVTFKDKEQKYSIISVNMKQDAYPDSAKTTLDYLIMQYGIQMVDVMLNNRINELSQQPDCPFVSAATDYGDFIISSTKDAFCLNVVPKDGQDIEALKVAMREVERARRFGFTATEYERAKAEYMSSLEQLYSNREKTSNTYFYDQYVGNFLENEPMPSIEDEYAVMSQIVPNIPVEVANQLVAQMISDKDSNMVVFMMAQEAEGKTYTTADQLRQAIAEVRAEQLQAYVDNVKNEPLVAQMPAKGQIKKTEENKALGYKKLTLSNGASVVLKKTDFQDDEILLRAVARGGSNHYGAADFTNIKVYDYIAGSCGLGNFSTTELQKALAGKKVNANPSLNLYSRSLTGNSTPKDIETLMQLTYLYFTDLRKDDKACQQMITQLDLLYKNRDLQPESVFSDSLQLTRYGHDPRFAPLKHDEIKDINVDRIVEMTHEMVADASQFTFYIVGNYDETTLLPLIEQYIASLPAAKKKGKVKAEPEVLSLVKGEVANRFTRKMETPKAQLYRFWNSALMPYTLENSVMADALGQALSMKLLRTIREENSAAYAVGANGFSQRTAADKQSYYILMAGCPMDPEKADLCYDLMTKGVEESANTLDTEDVTKVKEFMVKQAKVDARKNSYWLGVLRTYDDEGIDLHTDYEATVNALTPQKLAAFAKTIFASGDKCEVMMTPEK